MSYKYCIQILALTNLLTLSVEVVKNCCKYIGTLMDSYDPMELQREILMRKCVLWAPDQTSSVYDL